MLQMLAWSPVSRHSFGGVFGLKLNAYIIFQRTGALGKVHCSKMKRKGICWFQVSFEKCKDLNSNGLVLLYNESSGECI